eukprot:CAMPEP_0181233832 /NCGR_PEP_ID=MMETSP1096-20121128/36584_1 /TAXON_ID=156174 ORGANISM="Chrysochromulina ericina, Strain CCMP281" /NCGR_SAMPLE_ID=MMETSP1096 /ASSEMBLY_ACC=CAM_ASM_000453 /LENGTH=87 /DNA_ID=CAMNT_0023328435 /DNA_START=215 /DNA_END=475 /DNA_ORIENTATION=+
MGAEISTDCVAPTCCEVLDPSSRDTSRWESARSLAALSKEMCRSWLSACVGPHPHDHALYLTPQTVTSPSPRADAGGALRRSCTSEW